MKAGGILLIAGMLTAAIYRISVGRAFQSSIGVVVHFRWPTCWPPPTSGGVLGKMISPQNLAIAAAVLGLEWREGALFRKVVSWSLGLLVGLCLLVHLQSTPVLGWMVVG